MENSSESIQQTKNYSMNPDPELKRISNFRILQIFGAHKFTCSFYRNCYSIEKQIFRMHTTVYFDIIKSNLLQNGQCLVQIFFTFLSIFDFKNSI